MKKLFAICILSLLSNLTIGQNDSLRIYHWSELNEFNPDTIFALSLEKMKLEELPVALQKFKHLKYLNLSKNKLSQLPDFVKDFKKIESLNISKNRFEIFPSEICGLTNLKVLIANRNFFDQIPECIGFCTQLEVIDLWDTPVMNFPDSFQNLKQLKEIDLQGIKYGPTFQKEFQKKLFWVTIKFDTPCDCME